MKPELQRIQALLRRLGLLRATEQARFVLNCARHARANRRFRQAHPAFPLPPATLAYDAYGAVDWTSYHANGQARANYLVQLSRQHGLPTAAPQVMEWGCGPARLIRHFPALLGPAARIVGTDYNPATIAWAQAAIPGVMFIVNQLLPPIPLADQSFDLILAISVFTHLAEESGLAWRTELRRLLRPGGLLIFSTHGDRYQNVFLPEERARYEHEGFFCRARYTEGKKMFMAAHAPFYVRQTLLQGFEVREYLPGGSNEHTRQQDLWVAAGINNETHERHEKKDGTTDGPAFALRAMAGTHR